ncbi:MAG: hypothetical protein MAG451_02246 [Anaerolineales bacterium]|nr:hypothetical protein [Anaerolineales bacterium]
MAEFLGVVFILLLAAVIVFVVTVLAVAGFVGVGALIARFTELTLFQATLVSVPIGMVVVYLLNKVADYPVSPYAEDEWDEWDEWDEDLDFEDFPPEQRMRVLRKLVEFLEEEFGTDDVVIQTKPPRGRPRRGDR